MRGQLPNTGKALQTIFLILFFATVICMPGVSKAQNEPLSPEIHSALSLNSPPPPNTLRVLCHIAMSWIIGNHVAEPLIYVDNDNNFIPGLAKSYTISDHHMDIYLNTGINFQDGSSFNAKAVIKNYQHYLKSAERTSPYYTLDLRLAVHDLEEIAPDHLRIKFRKNGFIGQILVFLRSFYIYSPEFYKHTQGIYPKGNQANIWKPGPWGTGPYELTAVLENKGIAVLTRNRSYWQPGLPKTDAIILYGPKKFNSGTAHQLMVQGKADLFDAVNPSMLPSISRSQQSIPIIKHPISHLTTLFNTRKPKTPLKDIRIREALNHLIDRKTLFRYVSHQTAHITPFVYPLSEKQTLKPYPYDPVKARTLLSQVGFGPGFPLPIKIGYFATEEKLAKAIGAMLTEGGVDVSFDRYQTRQEYYQHVKNYTHGPLNPIEGETWDLNIVNSGLYTNTVATHFEAFFSQGGNRWIKADPKADELFLKAMRQRTPDLVDHWLRELEKYAYNQYYQMPIYIRPTILAVNKRIAGNAFSSSGYLLNLKDIEIGKTKWQ